MEKNLSMFYFITTIIFSKIEIKRKSSVKFLGIIINENVTWKNHIKVIENKVYKNIRLPYRASHSLDFKNLLKTHFFFVHIYISYANVASARTFKNNIQGILKKQKLAARIIIHANWFDHWRPLLNEIKVLNVYQINVFQTLKFMHKTKYKINPRTFVHQFSELDHQYPTRFSQNSFYYKNSACKITSFEITSI